MSTSSESVEPVERVEAFPYVLTYGLLLSAPALFCIFKAPVADPDVWWHLKAGEWILAHGAWPVADGFSSSGAGQPWAAYSWLPELLLYGLYQTLGLRGLVLFTAVFSVAIVAAFHALVRRLGTSPVVTVAVTLVAAFGLVSLETPRPWLASILLLLVELDLLLTAGRTGNRRLLLWLVPLFALWANMHIQFVLGLFVLGLAVAESVLLRIVPVRFADDDSRRIPPGWMFLIFAACTGATLINPYHYHLYEVAHQLVGQSKLWNVIQELQAMRFRTYSNWVVLAVALTAAFALGRSRRVRLLLPMLFVAAVYFGFRSIRDVWLVLLVGLTVLAYVAPKAAAWRARPKTSPNWAVAAVVALVVLAGTALLDESGLRRKVAERFPVEATEFLGQNGCAGPMFNSFEWGGYLMLGLPHVPVGIDGRTMVHGQDRIVQHANTLAAKDGWQNDPELARARLIVIPRQSNLAGVLRLDRRFRLAYEDSVAVVFGPRKTQNSERESL
ncbi:MAG: hypothetical protein ACYTG0_11915 [Planctomycetota bacterium]|jgi:hypothetical protein